jgi:hypothetical protein
MSWELDPSSLASAGDCSPPSSWAGPRVRAIFVAGVWILYESGVVAFER